MTEKSKIKKKENEMKKKFIRIWNNRKFRTFIQTFLSTIIMEFIGITYFSFDMNAFVCLLISAIATGLSAIMPLVSEEEIEII